LQLSPPKPLKSLGANGTLGGGAKAGLPSPVEPGLIAVRDNGADSSQLMQISSQFTTVKAKRMKKPSCSVLSIRQAAMDFSHSVINRSMNCLNPLTTLGSRLL